MPMKCETNLLQDITEFSLFLQLIKSNGVKSYLEIGSKHGGSLWRVANSLPPGSRVVSVDLPHGDTSFKESEPNLVQCVDALKAKGYDAHLFLTDSIDPDTIEKVRALGPFDLCFIDANHTEPYVRADWANYGPMARIVAFHDIGWKYLPHKPISKKFPIEAPKVWAEIKQRYKHQEIIKCEAANGIGVLWREKSSSASKEDNLAHGDWSDAR